MEKINIAEILKDCPKGMELDCTVFGGVVTFNGISEDKYYPINIKVLWDGVTYLHKLTKYGQLLNTSCCGCVIFPKSKTTWVGFQRPFKDGDIVVTTLKNIAIIKEPIGTGYSTHILLFNNLLHTATTKVGVARLATEEEKERLFRAIKKHGYTWNDETKTLEKLIKPKFKVGDKVRYKNNHNVVFTVTSIQEDSYGCGVAQAFWFDDQDDYELVPNKFDIHTLKPFDSRVLVRDRNNDEWRGQFFSHYNNCSDRPYICIGQEGLSEYKFCIPFEGNEHLLGKTDDCVDFYKTWE